VPAPLALLAIQIEMEMPSMTSAIGFIFTTKTLPLAPQARHKVAQS
jgi:hypothetical protein